MKILLAGATGYVGRRLECRLLDEKDVELRLFVRDARQVSKSTRDLVKIDEGDIHDREAVRKAVHDIDVVYYPAGFLGALSESQEFDSTSVQAFRDVCIEAGVKRLVYVGLHVAEHASIKLLRNVVETGKILSARPEKIQTVWFRSGILMGSGSVVFELLRNVVQKIPIIISCQWMDAKINPISVDDLVEYLVRSKDLEVKENLLIDIGSEQMTFKEMLKVAAHVMGLRRIFIPFPFTNRPSSFLLMLATPFSFRFSSLLIQVLQSGEIRPSQELGGSPQHYFPGIIPISFEKALEKAIYEIENDQVMSRWVDTLEKIFPVSSEEDLALAVYRDVKNMCFGDIPAHKIFRAVKSIGGKGGWFTFDFLWRIRGFLDKLVGGYGTAMGKRTVADLRVGDILDVWKVVALREDRRLLLEAQMKVFGKAWLEFKIEGNTLTQVAYYYPKGILGRLYWYSMIPFHVAIFRDMIRSIVKQARQME